jgi:phage terminase large subunit GpA-like protein
MSPPYRVSKIEVTAKGKKASYSIDLVWLSTDFFKSLLVSRIRTPLDQPGSFIVPDDIDEDYAKQLVSEVRVVDGATASRSGCRSRGPTTISTARRSPWRSATRSTSSASRMG